MLILVFGLTLEAPGRPMCPTFLNFQTLEEMLTDLSKSKFCQMIYQPHKFLSPHGQKVALSFLWQS